MNLLQEMKYVTFLFLANFFARFKIRFLSFALISGLSEILCGFTLDYCPHKGIIIFVVGRVYKPLAKRGKDCFVKKLHLICAALWFMAVVLSVKNVVSADTIRGINIDFVTIGNAGNPADTGGTPGRGAVGYNYRIGKYELTNAQWNAFTATAGAPTGNSVGGQNPYNENPDYTGIQQPTNCVSWFEALQFCNYLTSGNKSKGVYQFSGDNTNPGDFLGIDRAAAKATYGMIYFLPTADEWYKAAYYKPDISGYSNYANGQDTIPSADNGWNYTGGSYSEPWDVGTGTQEQNGTFDMMGNVWEMTETEIYSPLVHVILGGSCFNEKYPYLMSSGHWYRHDIIEDGDQGFRVASIPEPATLLLLGLGTRLCLRATRLRQRTTPR